MVGPVGGTSLLIAKSDGSGVRTLTAGTLTATEPAYRPPDGSEIAFVGFAAPFVDTGAAASTPAAGLYAVHPDGTGLRTIVEPTNLVMAHPRWSPDGTQIAYSAWAVDYDTGGSLVRAFVVASDGQANRIVKPIPDGDLNSAGEWSNDGRRLFVNGCHYDPANPDCVDTSVLVHVDGSGADVRIDTGAGAAGADGTTQRWSPDDGIIVTTLLGPEGRPMSEASSLWDPMTGRSRPAPWTGGEDPSWQRLAP